MSNNPIVHSEYIEIVTAEDLLSATPEDRAGKVVTTNASGIIPEILLPQSVTVTSLTVLQPGGGSQVLSGAVTITTPTGSAIAITANEVNSTITFNTTSVSSVNNLTQGITIRPANNLFVYTDVVNNTITLSDDLITPPANDTEIGSIIREFISDPVTGRVLSTTKKEVRGVTVSTIKTTTFSYDAKGRLTSEVLVVAGTGRTITKTYTYPASGSGLPEEIPLSYTKTIS